MLKYEVLLLSFPFGGALWGGSAEDELGILLPLPPKYWDGRSIEGYILFYVVLGIEPRNHMY